MSISLRSIIFETVLNLKFHFLVPSAVVVVIRLTLLTGLCYEMYWTRIMKVLISLIISQQKPGNRSIKLFSLTCVQFFVNAFQRSWSCVTRPSVSDDNGWLITC